VKDLFSDWLAEHFPDRQQKVLGRLREMRGGRLNDSTFGRRMTGDGEFARAIQAMFDLHRRRLGLTRPVALSTASFRRPGGAQGALF
jgi:DNA repair photolyase